MDHVALPEKPKKEDAANEPKFTFHLISNKLNLNLIYVKYNKSNYQSIFLNFKLSNYFLEYVFVKQSLIFVFLQIVSIDLRIFHCL